MTTGVQEVAFEQGTCRILIVDDEADVRLGLQMLARSLGAEVRTAESAEDAMRHLSGWIPHVVVSDVMMPGRSGLELLDDLQKQLPHVRVVLITGYGTIEKAVSAMHRGASHFITKPFDNDEVLDVMETLGRQCLIEECIREDRAQAVTTGASQLISRDPAMRPVLERVAQVAPTRMSVVVQGESGVGKELIARAVHAQSGAPEKPFLAVNTAALPDTLLESELFGHTRGAFTGAIRDRQGIFQRAQGGTVLLDEVGLMSLPFQGKLLRVLQERTIVPLGSSKPIDVDFRLIAATAQPLLQRIREGAFREDLYYRLNVVTIDIPPLRDRPEDILALATHFLAKHAGQVPGMDGRTLSLTSAAVAALRGHGWPGNVRELENCIQRALVVCGDGAIDEEHLGFRDAPAPVGAPGPMPYEQAKLDAVRRFQRDYLEQALTQAKGNITRAAEDCGMTRAALQRIMRALEIERGSYV